MNGIDKIVQRIRSDAQQAAEAMTAEAEKNASALRAAADQEAQEILETMRREGEAEGQRQYDLLLASADADSRKQLLNLKQELVERAFRRAVELMTEMKDEDYIRLLASLAASACETKQEKIILNQRDRDRVGSRVAEEANRLTGGSMTLAEETRPIVGGLILSQGRIEMNCALDTLAELRRNELAGQVAGLLFQ